MQDLQGPGLPMDAIGQPMPQWGAREFYNPYRQSEHPEASPVGNGQVGDANQIDHRNRDPAREEPAVNDGLDQWYFAAPGVEFENLAMNAGDMERHFNIMAHGKHPSMDSGWAEYDLGI